MVAQACKCQYSGGWSWNIILKFRIRPSLKIYCVYKNNTNVFGIIPTY